MTPPEEQTKDEQCAETVDVPELLRRYQRLHAEVMAMLKWAQAADLTEAGKAQAYRLYLAAHNMPLDTII